MYVCRRLTVSARAQCSRSNLGTLQYTPAVSVSNEESKDQSRFNSSSRTYATGWTKWRISAGGGVTTLSFTRLDDTFSTT
jgi:hypothetical protein